MPQSLQCLLLIYLHTKFSDAAPLAAAEKLINDKATKSRYGAGRVLLVRGPAYEPGSRIFSENFKDTYGAFAKLERGVQHDEENNTKFFINDLYVANPSNQTGGNGGGGDAVGKNEHRASLVDASSQFCAWRFEEPDYIESKIELFNAESLDGGAPLITTPPPEYDYKQKANQVQTALAYNLGINFAYVFDSANALNTFKTGQFKTDFNALTSGQSPRVLTFGMNQKTQEDGNWVLGALHFSSLDDAFKWLVSRKDVVPTLRKNVVSMFNMIVM
jgi:hypothetical protein